jgi:predicted O-methyltransferase YrrM
MSGSGAEKSLTFSTARKPIVNELQPYFEMLLGFDHSNIIALDRAHGMFLIGAVLSRKPQNILELGIGTGYITFSLIHAIQYNKCGKLTSVDNWTDWGGKEPQGVDRLRQSGVNLVVMGEREFVQQAPADAYDLLVSDADHFNSQNWLDDHLRITQHDGFLFFHDTNQPAYFPGLSTLEGRIRDKGLPHFHFKTNSRSDEHCDRGWLFVINKKR